VRVHVYAFGKLKTPGLREAADYYRKLASPWTHFEETELKPIPVSEKSPELRAKIQEKESQVVLDRLQAEGGVSGRHLLFLLDELGKPKSTSEWADQFRSWESTSLYQVSFCIGSSLGFSPALRKLAHGTWSLGPQTLSHELARIVLFEQIYRTYSILRGHPYHNAGS
jgi:23S rRNA (pseudouridine1915-N3)-methyltransferase